MTRKQFLASLVGLVLLRKLPKVEEDLRKLGKIYTATYAGNYKEELEQLERMTPNFVFFPHSTYHVTRMDGAFTANKRLLK